MSHRILQRFPVSFTAVLTALLGAQDMPLPQVPIDGQDWEIVSERHRFPEGSAVAAEGNLFFPDVIRSKIYKLDTEGNATLAFCASHECRDDFECRHLYETKFALRK